MPGGLANRHGGIRCDIGFRRLGDGTRRANGRHMPRLLLLTTILVPLTLVPACKKKSNTRVATSGDRTPPVDRTPPSRSDADRDTATVTTDDGDGGLAAMTLYFEFDSSTLTDGSRAELQRVATWMDGHRTARLTIEGHCDERGTTEYNVALGQRRAQAIQDYLLRLGVSATRLQTISYGEERPATTGDSEEAYAQNRRGELVTQR
jgi:peptidoglycan-associated lipoprotein